MDAHGAECDLPSFGVEPVALHESTVDVAENRFDHGGWMRGVWAWAGANTGVAPLRFAPVEMTGLEGASVEMRRFKAARLKRW